MDDAQKVARKKMLTQWLRHKQLAKNDRMQGPRKGRLPGAMKRFEDGSVGSTDRGIRGPSTSGKSGSKTPRVTAFYKKRWL